MEILLNWLNFPVFRKKPLFLVIYLEGFREEEALLDVVLGTVSGVHVLHARVAALHATVPLDRLEGVKLKLQ